MHMFINKGLYKSQNYILGYDIILNMNSIYTYIYKYIYSRLAETFIINWPVQGRKDITLGVGTQQFQIVHGM